MPHRALIALVAGLAALPAAAALAQGAARGEGAVHAGSAPPTGPTGCPNGLLSLAGTGRTVSPDGVCNAIEVSGSNNTVHVRVAPGASIGVSGTGNTVVWVPADPKGAPPAVHRTGTNNTVQRG